jgi:hypothetical protein
MFQFSGDDGEVVTLRPLTAEETVVRTTDEYRDADLSNKLFDPKTKRLYTVTRGPPREELGDTWLQANDPSNPRGYVAYANDSKSEDNTTLHRSLYDPRVWRSPLGGEFYLRTKRGALGDLPAYYHAPGFSMYRLVRPVSDPTELKLVHATFPRVAQSHIYQFPRTAKLYNAQGQACSLSPTDEPNWWLAADGSRWFLKKMRPTELRTFRKVNPRVQVLTSDAALERPELKPCYVLVATQDLGPDLRQAAPRLQREPVPNCIVFLEEVARLLAPPGGTGKCVVYTDWKPENVVAVFKPDSDVLHGIVRIDLADDVIVDAPPVQPQCMPGRLWFYFTRNYLDPDRWWDPRINQAYSLAAMAFLFVCGYTDVEAAAPELAHLQSTGHNCSRLAAAVSEARREPTKTVSDLFPELCALPQLLRDACQICFVACQCPHEDAWARVAAQLRTILKEHGLDQPPTCGSS